MITKQITIQTTDEEVANELVKAIQELQQEIINKGKAAKIGKLAEKLRKHKNLIILSL